MALMSQVPLESCTAPIGNGSLDLDSSPAKITAKAPKVNGHATNGHAADDHDDANSDMANGHKGKEQSEDYSPPDDDTQGSSTEKGDVEKPGANKTPKLSRKTSGPTLATKRSVRELLDTRDTPSKMEIGHGVILIADISGAELVVIQGSFEGTIKAQCVEIEQGAEVRGKIECDAARINGAFDGEFMCSHSLHLASHANVSGRVIYRRLKVSKGAQMFGNAEYRSPVLGAK